MDTGEELSCQLTSNDSTKYNASLVKYESPTLMHCVFAILPKGDYSMAITMNLRQYSETNFTLRVLPAMQILDVQPVSILIRSPGQLVMVQAENLVDDCWCVFEYLNMPQAPFGS